MHPSVGKGRKKARFRLVFIFCFVSGGFFAFLVVVVGLHSPMMGRPTSHQARQCIPPKSKVMDAYVATKMPRGETSSYFYYYYFWCVCVLWETTWKNSWDGITFSCHFLDFFFFFLFPPAALRYVRYADPVIRWQQARVKHGEGNSHSFDIFFRHTSVGPPMRRGVCRHLTFWLRCHTVPFFSFYICFPRVSFWLVYLCFCCCCYHAPIPPFSTPFIFFSWGKNRWKTQWEGKKGEGKRAFSYFHFILLLFCGRSRSRKAGGEAIVPTQTMQGGERKEGLGGAQKKKKKWWNRNSFRNKE